MAPPTVDEVRAWINVPATQISDELLAGVIAAETDLQGLACRVPVNETGGPDPGPALVQALYRRVGREVAARGLALGFLGLESEFGPARLSRFDAEIERLEGPYRVAAFGGPTPSAPAPAGSRTWTIGSGFGEPEARR